MTGPVPIILSGGSWAWYVVTCPRCGRRGEFAWHLLGMDDWEGVDGICNPGCGAVYPMTEAPETPMMTSATEDLYRKALLAADLLR